MLVLGSGYALRPIACEKADASWLSFGSSAAPCHWYRRTTAGPLAAPTLFVPSPADQSVRLSWSPVEGASGYKVKYGTVGGPLSSTVDAGPLTAYRVTTLTNGKKYRFAVVSYNETGEGQPSNGMEAVPGHQPLWESS